MSVDDNLHLHDVDHSHPEEVKKYAAKLPHSPYGDIQYITITGTSLAGPVKHSVIKW